MLSNIFRPLDPWLNRKVPLPERFYTDGFADKLDYEFEIWLAIEEHAHLQDVNSMRWLSLVDARKQTAEYLLEADEIIGGLSGGWLDREESLMISQELGKPPLPSLPLYLISCVDGEREKLVYVGKTEKSNRFLGGHSAALALHADKFNGQIKKVYRSTVWFYDRQNYICLDWLEPLGLAQRIIDSVESHLIFEMQPELNTSKKSKNFAKWQFGVHIQNFSGSGFLNDVFL